MKQPIDRNSKAVKMNTDSLSEILSVQKIINNKLRSWSNLKLRVNHGNLLNITTIMGDELKRFQWYDNIDMISVIVPTIFEPTGSDSDLIDNDGDPIWLTVKFIPVDAKDVDKTVTIDNVPPVNRLENPYKYWVYYRFCARTNGCTHQTVANSTLLGECLSHKSRYAISTFSRQRQQRLQSGGGCQHNN